MVPDCVLWTGGWDSTFRVLDLVIRQQRSVSPVYVVDKDRRSLETELATMGDIRAQLTKTNPEAAGRLASVRLIEKIEADDVYQRAWDRIRETNFLGTQYHWLPRSLAAAGISTSELCIHRQGDKASDVIGERVVENGARTYIDAPRGSDLYVLFSGFDFPLFNLTKQEMEAAAAAYGFSELLEMSWFCHTPTSKGKPCGTCNPCRGTHQAGLGRRVPRAYGRRFRRALIAPLRKTSLIARGLSKTDWLRGGK